MTEEMMDWNPCRHRRWGVFRIVGIAVGGVFLAGVLGLALGYFVQLLWNHTVVQLFSWPALSYWQAVGLFMLAKLLLSGVHHSGQSPHAPAWKWRAGRDGSRGRGDWETWAGREYREYWEKEGKAAYAAYLEKLNRPA